MRLGGLVECFARRANTGKLVTAPTPDARAEAVTYDCANRFP
jgi:hypothetical protein